MSTLEPTWLQSPWDHFVHAFPEMGEVASEAICEHCAPTSRLTDPLPGAKRCLACLLIHGGDLDRQQQRQGQNWRMEGD
jgi:hypothetical protein